MRSLALLSLLLTCGCSRSPLAGDPLEPPPDGGAESPDLARPSSPSSAQCGGFANIHCAPGFFCEWNDSPWCGQGDGIGRCRERPGACFQIDAPVCGCDGHTYGNDCERMSAGVGLQYRGVCGCTPPCSAGEYCVPCMAALRCRSLDGRCN